MRKLILLLSLAVAVHTTIFGQVENRQIDKLKVFIDCTSGWCDMTFIRTEVNLVDFMLDRVAADVHVLVTQQGTGGGGRNYQLIFFGQNYFRNLKDTIHFNSEPNATDFERRDQLVKFIQLGLAPYIAKTNQSKYITISMKRAEGKDEKKDSTTPAKKDPWNYWVFNTGINGNLNADAVYKSSNYSLNLSANRVTDKLKTGFSLNGGKNKTIYKIDNGNGSTDKIIIKNNNYNAEHFLIASLGQHWSYGYQLGLSRSTFSNNKNRLKLETGIEYAIFPYKQSNTKFFTVAYIISAQHNSYFDSTLYDKTKEMLYRHGMQTKLSFNQKWGTISFGAEYYNYLHNWKFLNLQVNTEINLRISGGLSLNVYTYAELSHDQIYLPKGGATPEEILTRRRQLASGYNYYTYFGLNYRFGSKLNNFVNPRFD